MLTTVVEPELENRRESENGDIGKVHWGQITKELSARLKSWGFFHQWLCLKSG